ncbi:MAG: LysM peptidoglycan-binding domain-containing protein [candidate division WOR-3 bacterium]
MRKLLRGIICILLIYGCIKYASEEQFNEIKVRESAVKALKLEIEKTKKNLSQLEEETEKRNKVVQLEPQLSEKKEFSLCRKLNPEEADSIIKALRMEEEELKKELEKLQEKFEAKDVGIFSPEEKSVVFEEKLSPKNVEILSYKVKPGDYLSKIAEFPEIYGRGNYRRWRDIYNANKDKIKDPNLILPGWNLNIPRP